VNAAKGIVELASAYLAISPDVVVAFLGYRITFLLLLYDSR
jgi:hypothetical protein